MRKMLTANGANWAKGTGMGKRRDYSTTEDRTEGRARGAGESQPLIGTNGSLMRQESEKMAGRVEWGEMVEKDPGQKLRT